MKIIFSKNFLKMYDRLPRQVSEKCNERFLLFEDDPFNKILRNHQLHGMYAHCRSINITGDIRILYTYTDDPEIVRFIAIGTHHELFGN